MHFTESNECRYSSKTAQKADWLAGHKIECKSWKRMRANGSSPGDYIPETPIRLLLRVLWRREQELQRLADGEKAPFWQSFDAVASLVDHASPGSDMPHKKRAMHQYIANKAMCALSEHVNTVIVCRQLLNLSLC